MVVAEKPLRAALAARVSTTEQAEHGTSLESQIEHTRAYALAQGYVVVESQVIREGHTGTDLQRAGIKRLLAGASRGDFDVIVFYTLDRVYRPKEQRDAWKAMELLDRFERLGVRVEFADPTLPTAGPLAAFNTILRASMAGMEREIIMRRMTEGKRKRWAEGKWASGRTPYGYRRGEDGQLQIVEEEAEVIRLIFDIYGVQRMGLEQLAQWLTHRYPTPTGDTLWRATTLHYILTRKTYHGEHVKLTVPPIITRAEYDRAQMRMKANKRLNVRGDIVWAFQGRIRCECGGTWGTAGRGTAPHGKSYYYCRNRLQWSTWVRLGNTPCDAPRREKENLERLVWDALREKFESPESLLQVLETSIEDMRLRMRDLSRDTAPLTDRLADLDSSLKRAARQELMGILDMEELLKFRNMVEEEKSEIQKKLDVMAPERLQEMEEARRMLVGAEEFMENAKARIRLGLGMNMFSTHPDVSESNELREYRKKGSVMVEQSPSGFNLCASLTRLLDQLHGEIIVYRDRVEVRGMVPVEVLLSEESGKIRSSAYKSSQ